jgi:hypothetical protein
MKQIQVHYEKPDGRRGVIGYFTGDNAGVTAAHDPEEAYQRLLQHAKSQAALWSNVFPYDKIFVCEVESNLTRRRRRDVQREDT